MLNWDTFWYVFADYDTEYGEGDITCQGLVGIGLELLEEMRPGLKPHPVKLCPALERADKMLAH